MPRNHCSLHYIYIHYHEKIHFSIGNRTCSPNTTAWTQGWIYSHVCVCVWCFWPKRLVIGWSFPLAGVTEGWIAVNCRHVCWLKCGNKLRKVTRYWGEPYITRPPDGPNYGKYATITCFLLRGSAAVMSSFQTPHQTHSQTSNAQTQCHPSDEGRLVNRGWVHIVPGPHHQGKQWITLIIVTEDGARRLKHKHHVMALCDRRERWQRTPRQRPETHHPPLNRIGLRAPDAD